MEPRRAALSDLPSLAPLFDAYRQFYGQPPDLPRAESFLRERLTRGDSVIFLAGEAGTGLGFTQLYPTFSSVRTAPAWVLNDLYVVPAARGTGVAEALMQRARRHAVETGACYLELTTARSNIVAQRLYERLGWQRDEEYYHYDLPVAP
jgi:ribosomal protein S18 acetylase RimI-like enzyme